MCLGSHRHRKVPLEFYPSPLPELCPKQYYVTARVPYPGWVALAIPVDAIEGGTRVVS